MFFLGEHNPVPVLWTPLGKDNPAPTSEANPGASAGPIGQSRETGREIAAVVGPPDPDANLGQCLTMKPRPGSSRAMSKGT
jgi:hypothetical protein